LMKALHGNKYEKSSVYQTETNTAGIDLLSGKRMIEA